jgi:hypothetical protein
MRHMYIIPGVTDGDKQRADAHRYAEGDKRDAPQTVRMHYHKHGEACSGEKHETFLAKGMEE